MIVADLQRLLADLEQLLATAGVKAAVLNELAAFREGLAPYHELTCKKLLERIAQADSATQGVAPPRGRQRAKAGGSERPDAETLAREVHLLYERATDPAVSEADIQALPARLNLLSKDGLLSVAKAIELKVAKSKSKEYITGEIVQRLLERKGVHRRAQLLGHPGEASVEPPVVGESGGEAEEALRPTASAFPGS